MFGRRTRLAAALLAGMVVDGVAECAALAYRRR